MKIKKNEIALWQKKNIATMREREGEGKKKKTKYDWNFCSFSMFLFMFFYLIQLWRHFYVLFHSFSELYSFLIFHFVLVCTFVGNRFLCIVLCTWARISFYQCLRIWNDFMDLIVIKYILLLFKESLQNIPSLYSHLFLHSYKMNIKPNSKPKNQSTFD